MTDTLIASVVVAAITILGVAAQLYAANRRWKKRDAAYFSRLAAHTERTSAPGQQLTTELRLPKWEPWRPDPQVSAARVASAIASLNATANDLDCVDDDFPLAPLGASATLSDETRSLVQSPSPALERTIAALNAIVETGETDDDGAPAPSVPIDLGGLADRLSRAGYDGGALKVAGVEIHPDRHVVVHLEPQRP